MFKNKTPSPLQVLLPLGLGTALSLIGDVSLYAVLPTHASDAGIALTHVGILLAANRLIRVVLNGPVGVLCDRWPRRRIVIPALFLGAWSTAIYCLTSGFWPLLLGRLLWGISWVGIWIGGNTIILDITDEKNRGRWVGLYHFSFFLGAASGSTVGGWLTDALGYHEAMGVAACMTFSGACVALLLLPETQGLSREPDRTADPSILTAPTHAIAPQAQLVSAAALLGVTRLAAAGILYSTFGLLLLEQMGDRIDVGKHTFGVATVTGFGLGITTVIAMVTAPLMGRLSDHANSRWPAAACGLAPGIAGFVLLALGTPRAILAGLLLVAVARGSNQSLATALIGDLGSSHRLGRRLGWLFTVGDLASAIGPLLAYALIALPWFGVSETYWLCAGLFLLVFLIALGWIVGLKRCC